MMKKSAVIFLSIGFFFASTFIFEVKAETDVDFSNQIKIKEEEIKKLEAEEARYKTALQGTQENAKTLKNQILLIQNQINKLNVDLKLTKAKISKTESNIKLHSIQIKNKATEIKNRQQAIGESIKLLARTDSQSLVAKMIINGKFSDFLSDSRYLVTLENGLFNNLKVLEAAKSDLENLVGEEKELKIDLNNLKKDLTYQNQLVVDQKQEKSVLLSETKNQEQEYQKIISKIQIRQAEIQNEISALENKLRGEVGNVPIAEPGILAWPLMGRITQGYGSTLITGFLNKSYTFHNGIDLTAYYGAPIQASLDGVVAASGDNGYYAYGKWLAIRHGNGLTTLYAHLSAKTVKIGDSVRRGEVVGYEGSSGFVTGPHLHFTIYSTNTFKTMNRWYGLLPLGGSVNPFDYILK